MDQRTFLGLPRESIAWFPTIEAGLCSNCGECSDLCANDVFAVDDEAGMMDVANPMNCVVLCDKCAPSCPSEAISFPDKGEARRELTRMIAAKKVAEQRDDGSQP